MLLPTGFYILALVSAALAALAAWQLGTHYVAWVPNGSEGRPAMTLLTDLDAPALRKIIEGQIDEIEGLRSEADKWRQIAEAAEVTNRGLWQDIETLRDKHAELLRFAGRSTGDA